MFNPEEPNFEKFPDWLTRIPPKMKCQVGKHMARKDIASDWPHHVEPALTDRAKVIFESPSGDRRSTVLVDHRIGPPTRYFGMSEDYAEVLELKRQNEERQQLRLLAMDPMSHVRDHNELVRGISGTNPGVHHGFWSSPSGRPYMAGLGSFLTAARLAEQLGGKNPYAYALGNPISYVDPDGTRPEKGHGKKCPPGWKLVSVTCYGKADPGHPKSDASAAYACNKNCGGKDRKGQTGDCAIDQRPGHRVCEPGQTVTIAYPGQAPGTIKTKCIVCDSGQGHSGIDVYVNVTDSDCGKYFDQTTYCVKCS